MNRQKILVTACVLASVSIGANVWLWQLRKGHTGGTPEVAEQKPAAPALPAAGEFDFSDTSFADGSWKLDAEKPKVPDLTGSGTPAAPAEATTGEKPVFKGTGLGDDSWKLGGGEKSGPPVMGPAKSDSPPPADKSAAPPAGAQGGNAARINPDETQAAR